MIPFLFRWLGQTIAVAVAAAVVHGIHYDNWLSLLIAALVLGILNSLVKPILKILSLPFIIMTFGLFLLVINALLLRMVAWLVNGFHVDGFWPAVWGSLVISIVSLFLGYNRPARRNRIIIDRTPSENSNRRGPPPGEGPIIDV